MYPSCYSTDLLRVACWIKKNPLEVVSVDGAHRSDCNTKTDKNRNSEIMQVRPTGNSRRLGNSKSQGIRFSSEVKRILVGSFFFTRDVWQTGDTIISGVKNRHWSAHAMHGLLLTRYWWVKNFFFLRNLCFHVRGVGTDIASCIYLPVLTCPASDWNSRANYSHVQKRFRARTAHALGMDIPTGQGLEPPSSMPVQSSSSTVSTAVGVLGFMLPATMCRSDMRIHVVFCLVTVKIPD